MKESKSKKKKKEKKKKKQKEKKKKKKKESSSDSVSLSCLLFNPYLANVLSHCYHLEESTFILRVSSDFNFSSHFQMKIL